ncbi:MAG TPA: 5'/3'-nucleotidase SurE [Desulfobulbaceae bacterium]|nr:5'/3'-nucleotidase SurE [Desulfobulbaceae bacterium]
MPTIFLTNDDGIHAPGLAALREMLAPLGRAVVVAPERDNSAVSHALTMGRPLRLQDMGGDRFAVDGTPTDCVIIGLARILSEKPALLVSGINRGANIGDDISYSGTVSAAIEATMYGVPAMAVSMAVFGETPVYERAAAVVRALAGKILGGGLPDNTLVNVNFPAGGLYQGVRLTRQGRRLWEDPIKEVRDPWGETRYWIGGGRFRVESEGDTDVAAVSDGYVSVTPIHLDTTNHLALEALRRNWSLDGLD